MRKRKKKIKTKTEDNKNKEKKKQDYLDIIWCLYALGFNKRFP